MAAAELHVFEPLVQTHVESQKHTNVLLLHVRPISLIFQEDLNLCTPRPLALSFRRELQSTSGYYYSCLPFSSKISFTVTVRLALLLYLVVVRLL
jgi:hypothetical protein